MIGERQLNCFLSGKVDRPRPHWGVNLSKILTRKNFLKNWKKIKRIHEWTKSYQKTQNNVSQLSNMNKQETAIVNILKDSKHQRGVYVLTGQFMYC
jgi:ribosomal protein S8